ncbi:MAG: hypothetical protein A2W85_02835 [Bacteroidetes bacterium GWF2_41_31]|nr:MAG: hypothetical protein A2W85_02835 [Bacteroidetes bacterium GWF2_41_31]
MFKVNLIIVLISAFVVSLYAQGSYKVVFEGPEHGVFSRIVATSQDEFIAIKFDYPFRTPKVITSEIYSFNNYSPYDTIRWELNLSRNDTAISARDIYCEPDGGFLISGIGVHYTYTDTLIIHNRFNWMMRLDAMKNVIWERFYPLPEEIRKTSVLSHMNFLALISGNYLLGETIQSDSIASIIHLYLIEINSQGEMVKSKVFYQSPGGWLMSLSYDFNTSSILLHKVGGELFDCANGIGAFILDTANYDTIGRVCYREIWKSYGFTEPYDAMLNQEGDLIVAGSYSHWNFSSNTMERFLGVERLDTLYQITHEIMLTDPDTMTYAAWANCLDINAQGEICVAGSFDNALGFFTDYYDLIYLAKLDPELNLISERYIGRDAEYTVDCMAATSDGGIAVGGYQYDYLVNEENEGDPFVIKTDAGLWLDTPQINEKNVHRALVYPNPGSHEINVRTTIKQAVFRLYNVSGNLIQEQPLYQLITTINTTSLPQGAYWWTLTQQEQISDRGKWIKY